MCWAKIEIARSGQGKALHFISQAWLGVIKYVQEALNRSREEGWHTEKSFFSAVNWRNTG